MVVIEQNINLPAVGTVPPSIRLTQYDTAIKLVFSLYNGASKFEKPEGGKAFISMTKADNKIVHVETTYNDDGTVEFQLTQQMTAAPGEAYCKLVVTGADGQVSTTSFILIVAEAGAKDGGVISESEISDVEKIVEAAEIAKDALTNITAAKTDALDSVDASKTDALDSVASSKSEALSAVAAAKTDAVDAAAEQVDIAKSWAVGPSGSGTGTDTNNAKYWSERAEKTVTGVTSFNGRTGAVTPQSGDYSYSDISDTPGNATTSEDGLMSAEDKAKLDGIATGANKTVVDSSFSSTSTNPLQNKVLNAAIAGLKATATTSAAGLMSATDKSKLDGIAAGATKSKRLATKSLTASGGTLTWTDSEIGDTTLIDVYATIPNIAPSEISQSGTTLTVTFDAQDSAFDVCVTIRN